MKQGHGDIFQSLVNSDINVPSPQGRGDKTSSMNNLYIHQTRTVKMAHNNKQETSHIQHKVLIFIVK